MINRNFFVNFFLAFILKSLIKTNIQIELIKENKNITTQQKSFKFEPYFIYHKLGKFILHYQFQYLCFKFVYLILTIFNSSTLVNDLFYIMKNQFLIYDSHLIFLCLNQFFFFFSCCTNIHIQLFFQINSMLSHSHSHSFFKEANKTGLDTTRFTTFNGSNFYNNSQTIGEVQKTSRYDEFFRKTRVLIDQLIQLAQDKRQDTKTGIKGVGDTNQYLLDRLGEKDYSCSENPPVTSLHRRITRHTTLDTDIQKLELQRMVQNQKQKTHNFERKSVYSKNQNDYLKQSRVSGNCKLERERTRTFSKPFSELVPAKNLVQSRLFAELQFLKEQNELLRQKTMNLLQSNHFD